ncbi:MAG: hypothetical protein HOY69_28795 [Streptomyces sp.]|nr:hypothetical protein [Streptomyces sp.]
MAGGRACDASGTTTGISHYNGGISLTERPTGQNAVVAIVTITSGDFNGDQLIYEIALLNTDLTACLTTAGVRQIAGPANLTVLPVRDHTRTRPPLPVHAATSTTR